MVTLRALHLLKVRHADLFFYSYTPFVFTGLVNSMAIGARLRWVAVGLMETARGGFMQAARWASQNTMQCD